MASVSFSNLTRMSVGGPSPAPPQQEAAPLTPRQKLLGATIADMFMPQYLPRANIEGKETAGEPTTTTATDASASSSKEEEENKNNAISQQQALLAQIAANQRQTIHKLKESNHKLKVFGAESDRVMPASSTALFQHVQLIAAVRKELEGLEMRVQRCMQRAERIRDFDEASNASVATASVGTASSTSQNVSASSPAGASLGSPTAATPKDLTEEGAATEGGGVSSSFAKNTGTVIGSPLGNVDKEEGSSSSSSQGEKEVAETGGEKAGGGEDAVDTAAANAASVKEGEDATQDVTADVTASE